MTYDSTNFKDVIVGSCLYGCGNFNGSSNWISWTIYHPLPLNITDLNDGMFRVDATEPYLYGFITLSYTKFAAELSQVCKK
jgi:hypothetical protein